MYIPTKQNAGKKNPVSYMQKNLSGLSVSIIIPAFNEEGNIQDCLNAVLNQSFDGTKQVIIADNHSTDDTRKICAKYPVQIVDGGKPAVARNRGAANAKGDLLLFLDADTIMPADFLNKAVKSYKKYNTTIASFFLKPRPGSLIMYLIFNIYNFYGWLASRIRLAVFNTAGCCLLVNRAVHNSISGFDDEMVVLEEYDYIRRIKKLGKFRVIPIKVSTSTRRFGKGQGIRKTIILFMYYFKWLTGKKIREDRYGYWK